MRKSQTVFNSKSKCLCRALILIGTCALFSSCAYFSSQEPAAEPNQNAEALAPERPVATDEAAPSFTPPQELVESAPPAPEREGTPVAINQLTRKNQVRIYWGIPEDAVDGYLIQYGHQKDNLEYQDRVTQSELETLKHPDLGEVYHHSLEEAKPNMSVFFRIISFKGDVSSLPSETMELKAKDNQTF